MVGPTEITLKSSASSTVLLGSALRLIFLAISRVAHHMEGYIESTANRSDASVSSLTWFADILRAVFEAVTGLADLVLAVFSANCRSTPARF